MPSLASLQREFAADLRDEAPDAACRHIVEDGFGAGERLGIYRNSCRSVLVAALRLAYPAVERLVGRDFFEEAAGRFAAAHPPASGYLNQYGSRFAQFLAAFVPARELAYLPDVARFEWALAMAANAEDAPALLADALARVDAARHAALRFFAHPSLQLLTLRFPGDRIADAVLGGDEEAMREIDLTSGPVRLVVHRGEGGIEVQRLNASDHAFLARLRAGERWGRLLDVAGVDAGALLAEQIVKGRLTTFETGDRP